MDLNLSVMALGATTGITYAVDRMSKSKGGKGGRIITTASVAGLVVSIDHYSCEKILSIGVTLQKFPPPNSSLESGGYSIAKFGNVVLTRSFPKMDIKPTPAEEGIKAFALCPFLSLPSWSRTSTRD